MPMKALQHDVMIVSSYTVKANRSVMFSVCIGTGDDPDEHASAPMERKKPETVEQAKARLVRELRDYYRTARRWWQP